MTITGQRLRALREKRGQSQEEIAKLIGVGRTTYLKYESGENKPTRKLKELAALFNVSTDYIMGVSDNPKGEQFAGQSRDHFLMFKGQFTPAEEAMVYAYRKAPDHIRQIVDTSLKPYQQAEPKKENQLPEAETTALDVHMTTDEVAKMLEKRKPKRIVWKKMDDKDKKYYLYIDIGGKNNKKKALYQTMLPGRDTPPNFVEKLLSTGKIVEDDE